ncbi:hypothetical protein EVAR_69176_1 [Eumeta japonica]|uniref:Uncharacterized protein n=1 Tax=Eumeta variegata TaxID=151549 RepID=A0A4C1ZFE4_EUMVA|nr:hypothetical protein EVAR_69176_1 [Eumeta japonica]
MTVVYFCVQVVKSVWLPSDFPQGVCFCRCRSTLMSRPDNGKRICILVISRQAFKLYNCPGIRAHNLFKVEELGCCGRAGAVRAVGLVPTVTEMTASFDSVKGYVLSEARSECRHLQRTEDLQNRPNCCSPIGVMRHPSMFTSLLRIHNLLLKLSHSDDKTIFPRVKTWTPHTTCLSDEGCAGTELSSRPLAAESGGQIVFRLRYYPVTFPPAARAPYPEHKYFSYTRPPRPGPVPGRCL